MPMWAGLSEEQVMEAFPHLTSEQIQAAHKYAKDYPEEIIKELQERTSDDTYNE
jgi:uncharacterized protein (DUF433 family)